MGAGGLSVVGKTILMPPIIAYLNDGRSCSPYSRKETPCRPLLSAVEPLDVIVLGNDSVEPVTIVDSKLKIVDMQNEAAFSRKDVKITRART